MKRRRLADLYKVGTEVTFEDGQGQPVSVWVQKLSPVDHETCVRKANAARARYLRALRDRDSDEWLVAFANVDELNSTDELVEILAQEELSEKQPAIEAEIADEAEWKDDNYLQGLFDAWQEGMAARFTEDEDDAEAAHVFGELKRFNDTVIKRTQDENAALIDEISTIPRDELITRVTEIFIKRSAAVVFMAEFERAQVFLSVREPDNHREYHFKGGIEDVDDLSEVVKDRIIKAYDEMRVDPIEGKGSGETQPSSTSSEQSDEEATDSSSGPQLATV